MLDTTYNKSLRVWLYDDPTNNPSLCSTAMVQDATLATNRSIGINGRYADPNKYCYSVGDNWYSTTISRTLGWHEMRFDFVTGNNLKMYIDGNLIYTDNSGAITGFNRMILGDQWAGYNGTVYYDDVTIEDIDTVQ